MDVQRERVQDDLRGILEGTVNCDLPTSLIYSTDAGIHQQAPLAVVCPRSRKDVVLTVQYAVENSWGIHPRGAGSFPSGESLGEGIILDFSRFMCRVLQADLDTIRVQPGVVRERLNAGMRPYDRMFGPDGGNPLASTIGGQIAINSAGSSWVKNGTPADLLLGLRAVLADGSEIEIADSDVQPSNPESPLGKICQKLTAVYEKYQGLIDRTPPHSSMHHAGYNLNALRGGKMDLLRLLAGSEGTLAIFTELKLRLQSIPLYCGACLFFFDSLKKAADAAMETLPFKVDSCDLMDRRHLHVAAEQDVRLDLLIPPQAEAALLVYFSNDNPIRVRDRLRQLSDHLCLYKSLAFAENLAFDEDEIRLFSFLRGSLQPLSGDPGGLQPIIFVDDATVNPKRLGDFIQQLLSLMQNNHVMSSIYCHAPQGQIHLHPLLNMRIPEERKRLSDFAIQYYELVWNYDGYLGREHGTGLSRLHFLKDQSPDYYEVYRAIKKAFDPDWTLQPGKVITSQLPQSFPYIRKDLVRPLNQIIASRNQTSRDTTKGTDNNRNDLPRTGSPNLDSASVNSASVDTTPSFRAATANSVNRVNWGSALSRQELPPEAVDTACRPLPTVSNDATFVPSQSEVSENLNSFASEVESRRRQPGFPFSDNQLELFVHESNASDRTKTPALGSNALTEPHGENPILADAPRPDSSAEQSCNTSNSNNAASTNDSASVFALQLEDRRNSDVNLRDITELQLDWRPETVALDSLRCTGCGCCRSQSPLQRSCPLFRLDPRESLSPRAKSNLIRSIVMGQLELKELLSDEVKQVLDGCFNCRSCQFECPVQAPIAQMILQARGAFVSAKGLNISEQLFAHLDIVSRFAIRFRSIAQLAIKTPWVRRLLDQTFGLAQNRKLPGIPRRAFLDEFGSLPEYERQASSKFEMSAHRRRDLPSDGSGSGSFRPQTPPKVMLFVSQFANYHDTELACAAVQILELNKVSIHLAPNQKPSGITELNQGLLDSAAFIARYNVNLMAEAIRDGYTIVSLEPADTFCLKYEYPMLMDNEEDVRLVSENTLDMSQYLWQLHTSGLLDLNFQPINMTIAYHAPCRLRALNIGYPSLNLLGLIPELKLNCLESGCCGMAGTYGLMSKNYHRSLRIGMPLITQLRNPLIQASSTECSSCRIAMEHRSTKICVHPVKLLAYAYGLLPELAQEMHKPGKDYTL